MIFLPDNLLLQSSDTDNLLLQSGGDLLLQTGGEGGVGLRTIPLNKFGTDTQRFPLYDPRAVRENRHRFRRDVLPILDRANSLYVPSGRWPVRGWILLRRGDYNNIDKYDTALTLDIGNPASGDNVQTMNHLSIVQAQCVTRGIASDEDALYLVELTDRRGIVSNKWFQFPVTDWFNIRAPAYPQTDRGGTYFTNSMNGGTTWTWSTMLQHLWETMGTFLGSWPGLPSGVTPLGTPEGFWFPGVSAWDALCDILDHLGLVVTCDLTQATPYTIVQPGADDSSFTALQTKYATHLEDDLEWIDVGAARVPANVDVLFRRRNEVYGTEETVRRDAFQWSTTPAHIVTVTAPAQFTGAVGTHYLWCDFTIRHDVDGNPLAADVAFASQIAQEQVLEYFTIIYRQTLGCMTQTYSGALPFATGSLVDGVCWYQDFQHQERQGWMTKLVRGTSPPFHGIY